MNNAEYDILMVGHFARDLLVIDGQGEMANGGAVYYGSVALRRLGVSVAVVTRLHPKDFACLDELRQEGVVVYAAPAPETSGIANYYNSADMERRICKPIGFAGAIRPEDIPDVRARVIMVASIIAGEVPLPLLQLLSKKAPIGLDVQGYVRVREGDDLIFKPWAEMEAGLACVTYLKVDRAEAEHLTGKTDLHEAARTLAAYGPKEIVLTQSSGVTVFAEGHFYEAPFNPRSLAGRTGRGDTCFSTYIGKRLTCSPEIACKWAGIVTSRKQEQPGPWRGSADELAHQIQ
ncbi:MAG TPA: PfkB family carbohydrate kinase [Anaerolineaceae bacterium]